MQIIKLVDGIPENWNNGIIDPLVSEEFAKANADDGTVYLCEDNSDKALIVIKKKVLKIFSRAQVFTSSTNNNFLEEIIIFLKKIKTPYARIGSTMSGITKTVALPSSKTIERATFIIDLTKSEEEIWKGLDKKLRNSIRKAKKEMVKINEIGEEGALEEYYKLSLKTQEEIRGRKGRKGFSIPSFYFFKRVLNNGLGKFITAKFEGKLIAGALFLFNANRTVYFQSFSSRDYTEKQAPSLIQWEAIKTFKKLGVEEYDLGGVTLGLDKNDSRFFVYEFKRKFNGTLREFYNLEIEINKWKKIQDFIIKFIYGEI